MDKYAFMIGLSVVMVGWGAAANAQQAVAPATGPSEALAEIIVTASRREETIQRSTLGIQVLDKQQLNTAGITGASVICC